MDDIWDRIEAWLRRHAPAVADGLNPPASEEEIQATETFLGVALPADVCASYRRHDGQSQDAPWLMDGWEWLSLARVRDEWAVWKDLLDGGDFDDLQSEADGSAVVTDWWHPRWIPVTYSGGGDHHCLDLNPGPQGNLGQVIEMWHDMGVRPVVALNFRAWLERFADDLEAGRYALDKEGGGLRRRDGG